MTSPGRRHVTAVGWTAALQDLACRHTGCRLVDGDAGVPAPANGGPVRAVIVGDSAIFRRTARELLPGRGYLVVGEVTTAAAARDAIERSLPHALLIDAGLPDGSGFELAADLTWAQPDLAVLLIGERSRL